MQKKESQAAPIQEVKIKRSIKDSVFSDLFKNRKYLLQLYQAIHPEDIMATESSFTDITLENVLTDNLYNDLGFIANNRLVILIEAQSTWTVNILVRILLYLAQSYHEYFKRTCQNLYKSKRVKLPEPELYVVYTGERGGKPDLISLSEEFFGGVDTAVDVKARVLYESESNDIINQYILFSKVYDEQRKQYGRTKKAITETIRICKDRDILREYLEDREKEVVSIMMSLFDEEEIMRSFIRSERYDVEKEAAVKMIKSGKLSVQEIAGYFSNLSEDDVKELEAEIMQVV